MYQKRSYNCLKKIKEMYKGKDGNLYYIKNRILYDVKIKNKDVIIPEGVVEIKDTAFKRNKTISSVVIPKSVKKIENEAFKCCYNLKNINIKAQIKKLNSFMFEGCENLISIDLPYTLEEIGRNVFSDCLNLKTIDLPSNLKTIEFDAFSGCRNLERILLEKVPEGLYETISSLINSDNFKELILITEDKNITVPYQILTSGKLQIVAPKEVKREIEDNSIDKYYKEKELKLALEIEETKRKLLKLQRDYYPFIKARTKRRVSIKLYFYPVNI